MANHLSLSSRQIVFMRTLIGGLFLGLVFFLSKGRLRALSDRRCLLFLLPDKRIVPYGFAGLPVVTLMCIVAATQLEPAARSMMIAVTLLYTLLPVLIGNLVSWTVYYRLRRKRALSGRG